jgi:hypothetical protein
MEGELMYLKGPGIFPGKKMVGGLNAAALIAALGFSLEKPLVALPFTYATSRTS